MSGKRCAEDLLGNGVCNQACLTEACLDDLGDCAGCNTECQLTSVGNGICDKQCNKLGLCDKDGGDCEVRTCNWIDGESYTGGGKCLRSLIGNGECDNQCDSLECDFDGGDCPPNECAPGCSFDMVGNGMCDDACKYVSYAPYYNAREGGIYT